MIAVVKFNGRVRTMTDYQLEGTAVVLALLATNPATARVRLLVNATNDCIDRLEVEEWPLFAAGITDLVADLKRQKSLRKRLRAEELKAICGRIEKARNRPAGSASR